ncbi:putative RNA-directed DNA polymerase [Tanacetum coccineum]
MTNTLNRFTVQSLWNNTPFDFAYSEPNGKSGGILAVWDTTYFTLIDSLKGEGYLALLGSWYNIEFPCLIVVVYAPHDLREKKVLWNNLIRVIENHNNFSILLGDFNEEIKEAVWNCGSSKAPDPDGFSFKLFKKYWSMLKHDIVSFVKDFKVSGLIPRGCNSSFITLVPKVEDPLVISDFRPISLIGSQYKIIAKILANRLSRVLPSVVGEVQMAYIKGRQIIDGPLMINEIIAWAKKHKKRLMFLKVDFEKAFDSLSWDFLFSILEQMGFSYKWRLWIRSCLNSAFASVLVNGSPTKEFKIERGLRQGDPLSPFLFILAVEALNVALLEASNSNIFKGVKVGKDSVHVSHLQFADDALILGEWSRSNAMNLSRILTCFHLSSGLKVNFNKSKLYGIGVSNVELNSLASTIGCLASQFPCIYLGLPIGANMSRCNHWSPLVERFHKRLSNWKSKSLSIGGRFTLIKSVLGSLGVYYFSSFKAPKKIINKLESIRRSFFWGGSMDENKISWIA